MVSDIRSPSRENLQGVYGWHYLVAEQTEAPGTLLLSRCDRLVMAVVECRGGIPLADPSPLPARNMNTDNATSAHNLRETTPCVRTESPLL